MRQFCIMLIAFAFLGIFASNNSFASGVSNAQINKIGSYENFGGGDVIVWIPGIPGCDGVWLSPTDSGFKQNLALLMAAYLNGKPVSLDVLDDQVWPGSTTARFCRLYDLNF